MMPKHLSLVWSLRGPVFICKCLGLSQFVLSRFTAWIYMYLQIGKVGTKCRLVSKE